MSYFKMFPTQDYDFNRDGILQTVVDLYRSVRPIQDYIDDLAAYTYVSIPNGERPDILAQRIYGSSDLHWTFFLVNDFLHEGISAWPMSQEDLQEYITIHYNGYALETRPDIVRNTDGGIINYKDSLAGRFKLKETITGQTSGATGTLTKKDVYLNQLVVQDVTGTFLGSGDGNTLEAVTGSISTDTVTAWIAWKYEEAPHHWYVSGDETEAHVSNANFFSTTDDAATNLILQEGSVAAAAYTSNRAYIHNLNDQRSQIRVVNPNFMSAFKRTFESLINV
jgi:hypothetical protein